jgi:FYVE zinc finger
MSHEMMTCSEENPLLDPFAADCYSYGVVAISVVSGLGLGALSGNQSRQWVPRTAEQVVTPHGLNVGDAEWQAEWDKLRGLVKVCIDSDPTKRPRFSDIVRDRLEPPGHESVAHLPDSRRVRPNHDAPDFAMIDNADIVHFFVSAGLSHLLSRCAKLHNCDLRSLLNMSEAELARTLGRRAAESADGHRLLSLVKMIQATFTAPTLPSAAVSEPVVGTAAALTGGASVSKVDVYALSMSSPSSVPAPRRWKFDSEASACASCGSLFTLFRRRHHCRLCGDVFCGNCVASVIIPDSILLAERPQSPFPIRIETDDKQVCKDCRALLERIDP